MVKQKQQQQQRKWKVGSVRCVKRTWTRGSPQFLLPAKISPHGPWRVANPKSAAAVCRHAPSIHSHITGLLLLSASTKLWKGTTFFFDYYSYLSLHPIMSSALPDNISKAPEKVGCDLRRMVNHSDIPSLTFPLRLSQFSFHLLCLYLSLSP